MQKAYLVVEHIVTDPAKFKEYLAMVGPMIAKHGGRSLTKGNAHQFPEGGHWKPELVAITEFPQGLVLFGRIPTAHLVSKAMHQRSRHVDHGRISIRPSYLWLLCSYLPNPILVGRHGDTKIYRKRQYCSSAADSE